VEHLDQLVMLVSVDQMAHRGSREPRDRGENREVLGPQEHQGSLDLQDKEEVLDLLETVVLRAMQELQELQVIRDHREVLDLLVIQGH
jgi:hypothetical protein